MANEAILRLRLGYPLPFTVANATAITKGALCALTDPRTAILSSSVAQPIAGICAREKVASDGLTEGAFWRTGWFDMVASGAIGVGQAVTAASTGSLNYISGAALISGGIASGAAIIGHALETASDNEVFLVAVQIGGGGGV